MRRLRKLANESARRKLPGTACCKISAGSNGVAGISSAALRLPLCVSPWTSRWYSSCSRCESLSLSLLISACMRVTLREAASNVPKRKLIDITSMQMLSMLCASSKTTTHSRCETRGYIYDTGGSHRAPSLKLSSSQQLFRPVAMHAPLYCAHQSQHTIEFFPASTWIRAPISSGQASTGSCIQPRWQMKCCSARDSMGTCATMTETG